MTIHVLSPWPFQREGIDALKATWALGELNRLALVFATGLGKTRTFTVLAAEHVAAHPGERILVLVHTDELVRQTVKTMRQVAPGLDVGVVKAAENQTGARVIVASVQTLARPERREQITGVGLVIVDECHHATAATYQAILAHYGCMPDCDHSSRAFDDPGCWDCRNTGFTGPPVPAAGFTATLARGDGQTLGGVWQAVPYSRGMSWGIRHRYLIPPIGYQVKVPDLDVDGLVGALGSALESAALGSAMATSLAPKLVAAEYLEHCRGRKGLGFAPDIASAYVFADAFNAVGITSAVVHSNRPGYPMTQQARDNILTDHRTGDIQVVWNVGILTEGYDDPSVNAIVLVRPTQSSPLYQQIVGRGLRVDPAVDYDAQDCVILQAVPVSSAHRLATLIDLSDRPLTEAADGKTLIELEDEFDLGAGLAPDPEHHWDGPVEVRPFDLLAESSSKAWITTREGHRALRAGLAAYVFLVPGTTPGTWTVCWTTPRGEPYQCHRRMHDDQCTPMHGLKGAITEHADLAPDLALPWAEDVAMALGFDPYGTYSDRSASWRKAIPSDAMLAEARRMGVDTRPYERGADRRGSKAGRLSDRMTRITVSRRVDPLVARICQTQQAR